jgi:hypothetical protein
VSASIEQRLQVLEDREAIRETWLDYCTQIDVADMDRLGDVFTEDAVLELEGLARAVDGEYHGRRSIIDDFYARTAEPSAHGFMTGHLSTNMQIELDGDGATTLAYFFEIVDNLLLIGTYQHRLRRDPERWRFASLRIAIRYRSRLEASDPGGVSVAEAMEKAI